MNRQDNSGDVKSLRRTFEIIGYLHEQNGARLGELTEDLELARSTIYNHLRTLKRIGYVTKEANTYHLSLQFLHLGEHTRHRKPEYGLARNRVDHLARNTNEEVDFTVPENGRMISLYHSVGDQISSGLQVGRWFHMHDTAAGKAVLARLSPEQVERIFKQWGLPARTEKTITNIEELEDELATVRERGYALNDQELLDGYHSLGVAIEYPHGELFGALTVGGPTYRIQASLKSSNMLETLRESAEELEQEIADTSTEDVNWWRETRDGLHK